MSKNLVIVESPSKSKTIEKYLGSDYKVVSSKGHIRDLSTTGKFGFGVDIENDFNPTYEPIKGKKKVIDELKKEAKKSDFVYLATDPDREGEAISWHLKDAMDLKDNAGLHVTIARWLLPSGDWIHEEGLAPDVKVGLPDSDQASDSAKLYDTQLEGAVNELRKK